MPNQFSFTAPSIQTLNSTDAPESLPPFPPIVGRRRRLFPAQLTVAENCRFTEQGGAQIRLGAQNIYSLGTGVKVDEMLGFETDNFAVLFAKSGTNIFQSNNPDAQTPIFYDIGASVTASQKGFLFAKRKDAIFTDQIDSELRIFTTALTTNADVANARFQAPIGDTDDFFDAAFIAFSASSSIFTAAAHGMTNGKVVQLANISGALPLGLAVATTYYIVNATVNTFQLSATLNGSAITTGDNGSGTSYFMQAGVVYIRGIQVNYMKRVVYTANSSTDIITAANHGLVKGIILTVQNTGGAAPGGLTVGTTYFVITATTNTFQLATVLNGPAIDITDTGSGINTFIAEDGFMRGALGLTSAMVTGDIVTQTTLYPNSPKGTCMGEILGACLMGGVAKDPSLLNYSVQSTGAAPTSFFDFASSGSGSKPMPRDITAILSGVRVTLIGMKKGLNYASGFDANGALLTTNLNGVHTIPNAKCITQQDENFAALTGEGRIIPIGQTNAGFKIIEDPKNPHNDMDYNVQGYMQANMDKTNTSNNFQFYDPGLRTLSNCIQIQSGLTAEVVQQTDVGAWSIDTTRNFSCKTLYKGKVYCGSDNMDAIYLQDVGIQDDVYDIPFRIVTGQMNYAFSRVSLDVLNVTINGLLAPTGQFIVNVYADGTLLYPITVTAAQLIAKGLMKINSGHPIGGGEVGADRIGDGGNGIQVYDFICPLEIMFECRKVQLEIISSDAIEIRSFDIPVENEGEELFDTL